MGFSTLFLAVFVGYLCAGTVLTFVKYGIEFVWITYKSHKFMKDMTKIDEFLQGSLAKVSSNRDNTDSTDNQDTEEDLKTTSKLH